MTATKQDLLNQMSQLRACTGPGSATEWVQEQELTTAQEIWESCESPPWMLWYAARCGIEHKTLVRLATAFARSVLFLVPENEQRPRICIETVEAWCEGHATIKQVRAARRDAAAAAAAADDYTAAAAAADAADAAAYAAAAAAAYAYADAAAAAYAYTAAAAAAYAYADAAAAAAYAAARIEIRKQVQLAQCELIRKAIPVVPFRGES